MCTRDIWAYSYQLLSFVSNPVAREDVHRRHHRTMHNEQSMIVKGSLVDKPNEPKILHWKNLGRNRDVTFKGLPFLSEAQRGSQ